VRKPQPRVNDVNRPFWDGCNNDRLLVQRCGAERCGRKVFYPRVCCPFCQGDALEWIEASGRGRITSHTTVRRTHHDSFNSEAPYVFAVVELEEGPFLYAQIPDAPTNDTSLLGRAVTVDFVRHGPNQKIAVFRLHLN
jgi:uncharacterized protein